MISGGEQVDKHSWYQANKKEKAEWLENLQEVIRNRENQGERR